MIEQSLADLVITGAMLLSLPGVLLGPIWAAILFAKGDLTAKDGAMTWGENVIYVIWWASFTASMVHLGCVLTGGFLDSSYRMPLGLTPTLLILFANVLPILVVEFFLKKKKPLGE